MHHELKIFAGQWLRAVLIALVPVVLTAFVTIPWNLGKHPGEPAMRVASAERHMT
ncbi:MAG: hypothetical protein KGL68_03165 [Burkholderiales bacterium]|nr:hypothetical protein [Burkholderiales bacterium]